jgi:hypothetical protein
MFTTITKFFSENFGTNHKLIKAIREDKHKNWEKHFNDFNQSTSSKANPIEMKSLGLEVYENNLRDFLSNLRITDDKRAILQSIQNYFGLSDTDINPIKRKFGLKAVDLLSKYRMQDFSLSDIEKYEIQLLATELTITKSEVDTINQKNAVDILQKLVNDKLASGRITDQEQQEIGKTANSLGLSATNLPLDVKTRELYEHSILLNQLEKGNLPVIYNAPIVVQKDEIVHWQVNATLLTPKTVTTGYVGGSRGVSIRVMKGVSYRVGSSRSTPIRESVTIRNAGNLIVTNKRIVFTGSGKSFSIGYKQLLSFDPYSNGIGLQKATGNGYLIELPNFQASEITFKVLENAINIFFS